MEPLCRLPSGACSTAPSDKALPPIPSLDLPAELTGFPLQISRGEILRGHDAIDPQDGWAARVLRRAGELLSGGLESATGRKVVVMGVHPREVLAKDFELPEGFPGLASVEEFGEAFRPPPRSSRRSRFDDWD